jgi:hypothetical protein
MRKACTTAILQLVLWVAVFFFLLRDRFEPPADWIGAAVMGFGAHLIMGMLINIVRRLRESRLVARAARGHVPGDGEQVAILGTIEPAGKPLIAPLSGLPAVLYDYKIDARLNKSRQTVFSGFGLSPAAIRASIGNVRLLGFPALKKFEVDRDIEDHAAVDGRLSSMPWTRIEGLHAFSRIERMVEDADGRVLENFRMTDRESAAGLWMAETRVEPGMRVCAIGRWSAAKSGLVPSKVGTGESLKLLRVDDAAAALRSLRASAVLLAIGAILTMLFIHGGGWLMLNSIERESKTVTKKERRWWTAIEENRVAAVKRIAKRLPVDHRDGEGRTALMYAQSPEMIAALLDLGADPNARSETGLTPLMRVVWSRDEPESARRLLTAGADINAQDQSGETPLGYSLSRGHERTTRYLQEHGAR